MKHSHHNRSRHPQLQAAREEIRQGGSALLIVLAFLVLVTVLVMAFFSSVTTESSSAKSYANQITTKQVADSALHCVMGAIREATSQGANIVWATQPGMIRTYGNSGNTASSNPLAYYKLYSSDSMVVTNGLSTYDTTNDLASDWISKPAMWTDLNSPVIASGTTNFPIISGNGIKPLTMNAAGVTVPRYYGYDTNGDGYPDIDGFAIDPSRVTYNPNNPLSVSNNPVAMPVKWIYVLRDGTLTTPDGIDASGKTVTWTAMPAAKTPSRDNPIVARIAFWTDDETCKLNLNTASEGSYWDAPRLASTMDLALGRNGPAQREYNRYPGHPAGVSLSPVLGAALGLPEPTRFSLQAIVTQSLVGGVSVTLNGDPQPRLPAGVDTYLTKLFGITPRFVWGGSKMGSMPTASGITGSAGIARADLQLDRLYASVDEALYASPSATATTRPLNPTNAAGFTPSSVDTMRFFLTTSSRAPEVNPFNQPKITMWPIDDETRVNPTNDYFPTTTDQRSPLDKVIAFCSTINGRRYYFTRNDPFNPGGDFTERNRQLYDYLLGRFSSLLPGYGASFSSRYPGSQCAQLVTQFYDFIRGCINLNDGTAPGTPGTTAPYLYSFCKPFESRLLPDPYGYAMVRRGLGEVAPFRHPSNGTKGIGRFPTIQQAGIMFMATAANQPPLQVGADGTPVGGAINPLHPFPGSLPTTVTGALNSNGQTIYRFPSANFFPNPTLFTTNSTSTNWMAAPSLAGNSPLLNSLTNPACFAQAHSGLRYLTEQNPTTGAFDMLNPRYRGPALGYGQTQIQAVLFFSMANPAAGNPCLGSHYKLRVRGAEQFRVGGGPLNMRNGTKEIRSDDGVIAEISNAGVMGFGNQLRGRFSGDTPEKLVFYSDPVIVNNDTSPGSRSFAFTGGTITVEILNPIDDSVVQTAQIEFPNANFPTPILKPTLYINPGHARLGYGFNLTGGYPILPGDLVPSSMLTLDNTSQLSTNPNFGTGGSYFDTGGRTRFRDRTDPRSQTWLLCPPLNEYDTADVRFRLTCDTIRVVEVAYGDTRLTASLQSIPKEFFVPNRYYHDPEMPSAHSLLEGSYWGVAFLRGATQEGLNDCFKNEPSTSLVYDRNTSWPELLPASFASKFRNLPSPLGGTHRNSDFPIVTSSATFGLNNAQYLALWPGLTNSFSQLWSRSGDFDNGIITGAEGPLINKPEEGMSTGDVTAPNQNPYFGTWNRYYLVGDSVYSPNRQIASAVAFGSLPAGIDPLSPSPSQAYRTLLFCPNPNSPNHPALAQNPPDYALLDFFHMPVVEPYAISEPFSTAGKVNMNYQIAPFSYINRETAIRGVLRGVSITAVPDRWIKFYRNRPNVGSDTAIGADGITRLNQSSSGFNPFRYPICEDDTLKEFQYRFDQNDIFRSPAEICSLWLYPAVQRNISTAAQPQKSLLNPGSTEASDHAVIRRWWYDGPGADRKALTGDNLREQPYNCLYPRLTTKSNTFTVHVRVQSLMKLRSDPQQNNWTDGKDKILGEFRGSFAIERYIDPSDPNIPDFAVDPTETLDSHYRFRVLSSKQFGQ